MRRTRRTKPVQNLDICGINITLRVQNAIFKFYVVGLKENEKLVENKGCMKIIPKSIPRCYQNNRISQTKRQE